MDDILKYPKVQLDNSPEVNGIIRPKSVVVIATLFFILGVIDLALSLKSGLIYETDSFDSNGAVIRTTYYVNLVWLILYAIGAGLMRGGKFARVVVCVLGIIALIVPGAIFIYYLYFTEAKNYFNNKICTKCGETSYLNSGYLFKGIHCRQCNKNIKQW